MKIRKLRQEALVLALLLASAAVPAAALGQAQVVFFGTAEADTEDQSLLLLGGSLQMARPGWQPVVGVLGYRLTYPISDVATETLYALNPSLGLRHQWTSGAAQASVGYLFLSDEVTGGFGAPGGAEEGVTASALADYWGTGARTAQAIVSFNFAEEYAWSRLRGAQRIARLGGDLRVGAEAVLQGGGDGPGEDYRALQIGPMLQLQPTPALQLIASAGAKTDNADLPDRPDWFPYVKFEFVLVP